MRQIPKYKRIALWLYEPAQCIANIRKAPDENEECAEENKILSHCFFFWLLFLVIRPFGIGRHAQCLACCSCQRRRSAWIRVG